MKHAELKELIPLYIDGGLEQDEIEMIEAHLAECAECRNQLQIYQKNFDLLSSLDAVEFDSSSFLSSIIDKVAEERQMVKNSRKNSSERRGWFEMLKDIFKVRSKIPIGSLGIGLAIILLIFIINPFKVPQDDRALPESTKQGEIRRELYGDEKLNFQMGGQEMAEMKLSADPDSLQGTQIERKIIKSAYLRVEVKDIQAADNQLVALVDQLNGFISNSRRWETSNQRQFSSFTLRIPVDHFTEVMSQIEALGEVKDRSLHGYDVTEEYIDIDSRLQNLTLQEDRYRELLNQAVEVEDILQIERELERVRSTIESLQGRLEYLDDQVGLSTINVEFMEPEPINFSNMGISSALRQAVKKMVDTFYQLIIGIGMILPYLFLISLVYVGFKIFKRK